MARAIRSSITELHRLVMASRSRAATLIKGTGIPGTRAFPARTKANDAKFGVRIDNGEIVVRNGQEYKQYKFQANKEAENSTIRKIAEKNPHGVLAVAEIRVIKDFTDEEADEIITDFFGEAAEKISV